MNSQSQAIEEGIKIALDAADTATSVVGEFGHIKADYAEARKQMGPVGSAFMYRTIYFSD